MTETATVTVNVSAASDMVDDTLATAEDTPVSANVISGGAGADNFEGSVSLTAVGTAGHGTVSYAANGAVTYTPTADYYGSDSFTYTVTSASGVTETATVTVNVSAASDMVDDTLATAEDTPVSANVISGGAGADNFEGSVSLTAVGTAGHGTVSYAANGAVTYTPTADYYGSDSFTYTVTSASGVTETATVTVNVSAASDMVDDTLATAEDTPVSANVISGGAGADNFEGSVSLTAVGTAGHGTVSYAANGAVTYTPTADYYGSDSFTYTVTSASGVTETATVTVNVSAASDMVDDTLATAEDTPVSANVISGGAGADNFEGSVSLTAVGTAGHGTVSYAANGAVTYTPTADYYGSDSFTYTVTSASGVTETATVTVNVSAASDMVDDTLATAEDTPVSANVISGGAGADNFEGSVSLTAVGTAGHGTVSYAANGAVTYTPTADYYGSDSFTYTVTSASGVTETATVTVNVSAASDMVDDTLATAEDTPVSANVISGGAGADNFEGSVSLTAVGTAGHGTVSYAANGAVTYTPTADYYGSDSFTYTVTSASGVTRRPR